MVAFTSLTAEDLVRIPLDRPERLFSRTGIQAEYRALAKLWHPDVASAGGDQVFKHITALHASAEEKLAAGIWDGRGRLELVAVDGTRYRIRYRSRRAFEPGEMLIGDSVIVYLVDPLQRDLFEQGLATIQGFRFADAAMGKVMSPWLPDVAATFETADRSGVTDRLVLVLRKGAGLLSLADVLAQFGGKLPPRHVAWIMSSLFNLACWLSWAGLCHNAIEADTVFLSPQQHQSALLGGWWYAAQAGKPLKALPDRSADAVSPSVLSRRLADHRIDGALLRLLGRELLGNALGSRLSADLAIPAPMVAWLRLAADGDALADYAAWGEVLKESFGPRRFVPLSLTADDLYPAD